MNKTDESQILYAFPSDDYVVFRVVGRGTFSNSVPLKDTVQRMRQRNPRVRFILDLEQCSSMDSTFMGVLASMGLGRRSDSLPNLTIVHAKEHSRKLLSTLGLTHFLDVREPPQAPTAPPEAFVPAREAAVDKREQILHMIQAHQELINLDSKNKVRFENVLRYLDESLQRVEKKGGGWSS